MTETDRVREALSHVPAGDRDAWVRIGMAVKAELGEDGFGIWDAWSQEGESYNARDAKDVWRRIRSDGKVTGATLFGEAKAHGWQPKVNGSYAGPTPDELAARKRAAAERAAQQEAKDEARHADAASKAAVIWDKAAEAPADHCYLMDKGIKPHGTRVHAGQIVVPVGVDGELRSLQFIQGNGEKRFLTDGAVVGGYYAIGKPDGVLCVVEGFATGASVHEATGHAVAVGFNAGNLRHVAKALRAKYPDAKLIICADDDHQTTGNPGLTKATEAARAIGGLLAIPDFGPDRPEGATDFNDLVRHAGRDAVKRAVESAKAPEIPQRYRLLTSNDLGAMPMPEWRIRGVLPAEGLVGIYGPSTAGKSFLTLDSGTAISTGEPWFGFRVERAPVVYVVLEGEAGFRMRVKAWETAKGCTLPMLTVMQPFRLNDIRDINDLSSAILQAAGRGSVIIVDTYNRAAPGMDENAAKDTGLILEACKKWRAWAPRWVVMAGMRSTPKFSEFAVFGDFPRRNSPLPLYRRGSISESRISAVGQWDKSAGSCNRFTRTGTPVQLSPRRSHNGCWLCA